jgi:hypothetical protein
MPHHHQYDPAAVRIAIESNHAFYRSIWGDDVRHIREMTRQQILGDRELLRDIDAGREVSFERQQVVDRLFFVERLAQYCGLELPPLLVDEGRDVLSELTDDVH